MQIDLKRLENAVRDIKENWTTTKDSNTNAEYWGMLEGLDMLVKHFREINEEKDNEV